MAVIVVIALFAIMLIFLGMSLRSLNRVRQYIKLIERQQLQRLRQDYRATNSPAVTYHLQLTNASAPNR